jgi:hypothetical protein
MKTNPNDKISSDDIKKIRRNHHLHKKTGQTKLGYNTWLDNYFWDPFSKKEIENYLRYVGKNHEGVKTVISRHPSGKERTPIHLPYIYMHEVYFHDNLKIVLFQKFNFSRSINSVFASIIWSYLPMMSSEFRKHHRIYEAKHNYKNNFIKPHPKHLWVNYQNFLYILGDNWKEKEKGIGPIWIAVNDVTAVTQAIYREEGEVGISVYSKLTDAIHKSLNTQNINKKDFERYGNAVGATMKNYYEKNSVLIDINLGNFILDSKSRARLIDGELFQVFKTEVPAHYVGLEVVNMMETVFLETVLDYCDCVNSLKSEDILAYQESLNVFFLSLLKNLRLSDEEVQIALRVFQNRSTKQTNLFFKTLLSLKGNNKIINKYQCLLQGNLRSILENI